METTNSNSLQLWRNQIISIMQRIPLVDGDRKTTLHAEFIDPKTVEILANADGKLWIEKQGSPMICMGTINALDVGTIIKITSSFHGRSLTADNPVCEAEFPVDYSRFEGLMPPTVSAPIFSIRKKAVTIYTLDDYVKQGVMTLQQKQIISDATASKQNILICGGTGTGKTTLVNAIIEESVRRTPNDRFLIIEDTGEIQCSAKNKVMLHTTPTVSMADLLRASLRLRPDRISVGEVRGQEALDLLDSWNTGHSGGFATIHADSALKALDRVKSCTTRNKFCPSDVEKIIGEAIHIIVHIQRTQKGREIKDILKIINYDPAKRAYNFEKC